MHALACVLQLKTGNGLRTVASAAVFFLNSFNKGLLKTAALPDSAAHV
jgi:hypothetical protein